MSQEFVDYPVLRGVPIHVDTAVQALIGEKVKGRGSPRPEQLRILVCLHALGPDLAAPAYDLWQSALKIALRQRNEDDIKSSEAVRGSLFQEIPEFDMALDAFQTGHLPFVKLLNRLSSILYYNTLSYVQDLDIRNFQAVLNYYAQKVDIPALVAMRVADVKYLVRGATNSLDRDAEERAMLSTYEQFMELVKIAQKKLDNDII